MSRKSRLTLSKERLTEMSDCPLDIFDAIEPEEELFELIERADGGDADAVRELTELTCEAYLYDEEPSESLLHYAKKGKFHTEFSQINGFTEFNHFTFCIM